MARVFVNVLLIVMMLRQTKGISSCSDQGYVNIMYRVLMPNPYCLSCAEFRKQSLDLQRFLCAEGANTGFKNENEYDVDFGLDDGEKQLFNSIRDLPSYRDESSMDLKITAAHLTTFKNDLSWRLNDVKRLDISANDIGIIPEAFFYSFPDIVSLDLSGNNLTSISVQDFQYLNGLQVLNLSFNRISHLTDAFEHTLDLFDIDLSHNKISNIPKDLFQTQLHLENLKLSYNEMVRFEVVFPKYSKFIMNELDLSFNKLKNVSINKTVRHLVINHNNLTEFPLNIDENLVSLNLSHNRLVKIDGDSMLNAVNVLNIDLSYNALHRLPTASFRNQKKLSSLNISNNLLAESSFGSYNNWATFFYNFAVLKSVDLNNNLWRCTELKDIMHMLTSRSIDVTQGNYHNSSNILGVKCIETYRNKTSGFNESESEIRQTIGIDILTQVLENISPQFNKLEEINKILLNQTSSNVQKINSTITNMESFKTNISTVINDILANISKTNGNFENFISNNNMHSGRMNNERIDYKFIKDGFTNVEEQIKSIAAYQQNSEKIGHGNSETADKLLAEVWSRLAKNMSQVIPKATDSEIKGEKNTAKLTVQSDKQVAESKEILERISEGTNAVSGMVVQNLLLSFILGALLYNLFIKIKGKRRNAPRDELNLVQA